jgi:hypothetical protein
VALLVIVSELNLCSPLYFASWYSRDSHGPLQQQQQQHRHHQPLVIVCPQPDLTELDTHVTIIHPSLVHFLNSSLFTQRITVEEALAHPFLRSVSAGQPPVVSTAGLEMVEGLLSLDASQLKQKLHGEVAAFAAENEAAMLNVVGKTGAAITDKKPSRPTPAASAAAAAAAAATDASVHSR